MKQKHLIAATILLGAVAAAPGAFPGGNPEALAQTFDADSLPANPKPGECYARVHVPASTKQVAKRIMTKEGTDELIVSPAQYEWVTETVEIEGASERLEIVPAKYETRTKTIVIEPEREEVVSVPAEYQEVTERVLVRQSYTEWKRGTGPIQRIDSATGEIMCLVTVPAEYKTVTTRKVRTPARVERRTIPAKVETVQVRVMVEPPSTRRITIPAKTQQVRVRKLVEPNRVQRRKIEPAFATVMETVKSNEARIEWRPILCETNAKPDLIAELQRALAQRGYNPGKVDGVIGAGTMRAVERFQKANGLASGNITIETLNRLGIDPRG
ncbi:MAG: peptidoglycan-binding protein [Neomegalonema sp.]|nr:peptidoglycan-binding protein [Neomegalonema sp.]